MQRCRREASAFTLIELLVTIGIIGILASIVISILNPADVFADANDAQRRADLNAILKAVEQLKIDEWRLPVDNNGDPSLRPTELEICAFDSSDARNGTCLGLGFANLLELVPVYLSEIPVDPQYDPADFPADFRAPYRTRYFIRVDEEERVFVRSEDFDNGEGLTLPVE